MRRDPPFLTGPPPPSYKVETVGDGAILARDGPNTNFPSVIRVPDWVPRKSRAHPKAKYYLYYSSHTSKHISMNWASQVRGPWTPFHLNAGPFLVNGTQERTTRGVMDFDADPERFDWEHVGSPDVHIVDRTFIMYFHGRNGPDSRGTHPDATRIPTVFHRGFAATSATGLNFNGPLAGGEEGHGPITVTYNDGDNDVTTEVCVNDRYSRVFYRRRPHRGRKNKGRTFVDGPYAVGRVGAVARPADFGKPLQARTAFNVSLPRPNVQNLRVVQPWQCTWLRYERPTALFNATSTGKFALLDESAVATYLASEEFARHPHNPVPGGRIGKEDRLNHVGVFALDDGRIEVFFWVKGRATDRYVDIYRMILDVSDNDLAQWDVSRDAETNQAYFDVILTPQDASKIVGKALRREAKKKAGGNPVNTTTSPLDFATDIHHLGDPFVFWDAVNEKKYLFVSYSLPPELNLVKNPKGEGQIVAFRLVPRQ